MVRHQTSRIFDQLGALGARLRRFAGEVKAGLDALHRVQYDEPWTRNRRPTHEEWQIYIAPRPRPSRQTREMKASFVARPASR